MEVGNRRKHIKNITFISGAVNLFLGVLKVVTGIMWHSHALATDGVHSFADIICDIMVFFAAKYGDESPDHSHPYGHQRIETAATLLLSLLLILTGLGIALDSISTIFSQELATSPNFLSLIVALISVLCNEIIFQYTKFTAKKIKSDLLMAQAWHHRSDVFASLVVIVGILGSLLGFFYLDIAASIVIAVFIIKMGFDYGWNSIKELVDTAVSANKIAAISSIITAVAGVEKIHQLRTRSMGNNILIDVHVIVEPRISVSAGHFIAQRVRRDLLLGMPEVQDVTVHIDPEDDELYDSTSSLPSAQLINSELITKIQAQYPTSFDSFVLHYLAGKIDLDLVFINNEFDIVWLHKVIKKYNVKSKVINKLKVLVVFRG
jgi:cation diffusion facilitator family transporter